MFSSVDAPDMRFLECRGSGVDGAPLDVSLAGAFQDKLGKRVRTLPNQGLLEAIARHILESDLILVASRQQELFEHLKAENPGRSFEDVRAPTSRPVYRLRTAKDPAPSSTSPAVRLQRVELQMWRLRFDGDPCRVFCEKLPFRAVVEASGR